MYRYPTLAFTKTVFLEGTILSKTWQWFKHFIDSKLSCYPLSCFTQQVFFFSSDFFLCRKCGREIVEVADMINIPSKLTMRQRNETFGLKSEVLIQLFKNPHGMFILKVDNIIYSRS